MDLRTGIEALWRVALRRDSSVSVRVEVSVSLHASPSFVEAIRASVNDVGLLNSRLTKRTEDLGVSNFFCTFFILLSDELFTIFEILFFHL